MVYGIGPKRCLCETGCNPEMVLIESLARLGKGVVAIAGRQDPLFYLREDLSRGRSNPYGTKTDRLADGEAD